MRVGQHFTDRYLLVFDWRSKRLGSGPDEINVSLNGSAIQVTLFDEEDGTPEQKQSQNEDGPRLANLPSESQQDVTAREAKKPNSVRIEEACVECGFDYDKSLIDLACELGFDAIAKAEGHVNACNISDEELQRLLDRCGHM